MSIHDETVPEEIGLSGIGTGGSALADATMLADDAHPESDQDVFQVDESAAAPDAGKPPRRRRKRRAEEEDSDAPKDEASTDAPAELDLSPAKASDLSRLLRERDSLFDQHPVVRWDKYFAVPTPEIIRLSEVISHSVLRARSGRAIAGISRHGKSRLITYFTRCIRSEPGFKRIPVFCMDASHSTRASELDFYADMLNATGYRLMKIRPAKERRNQCINHLIEISRASGDRRIVLFVDEAQWWTFNEWTWLKEVDIGLSHENIALIVIPVGQPELRHVRTVLKQANRRDLTTRFLRRIFEFGGFRSEEQLRELFEVFDMLRYPDENGWTYSQFFFPRAWAAGWRLAKEARTAWAELVKAIPALDEPDFGMESVAFTIQHFLAEFYVDDAPGFIGTTEQWAEAVDAADLAEIEGGLDTVPDDAADEDDADES